MIIIQAVFFHDLILMIGGGAGTHTLQGGDFTYIQPFENTVHYGGLRSRLHAMRTAGAAEFPACGVGSRGGHTMLKLAFNDRQQLRNTGRF